MNYNADSDSQSYQSEHSDDNTQQYIEQDINIEQEEIKESQVLGNEQQAVQQKKKTVRKTLDEKLLIQINKKIQTLKDKLTKTNTKIQKTKQTKKYMSMDRHQQDGYIAQFEDDQDELQQKIKIWDNIIPELQKDIYNHQQKDIQKKNNIKDNKKDTIKDIVKVKKPKSIPDNALEQWQFILNNFKEEDDIQTKCNICKIIYKNPQQIIQYISDQFDQLLKHAKQPIVDKESLQLECKQLHNIFHMLYLLDDYKKFTKAKKDKAEQLRKITHDIQDTINNKYNQIMK